MMAFQDDPTLIKWRIHLASPPETVYGLISTDGGRARFWAESAPQVGSHVHFSFPDGKMWKGEILEASPPSLFRLQYYGGSITTFELQPDGLGGTDLTLTDEGVDQDFRCEVIAGWVSVLIALKAAVDFSVDLRNHDPNRTWQEGYADN